MAGKRAGLAGERSGLYMEQIRIIKEMRHHDALRGRANESVRPRYMVWENVPGAFSSNQGKDFSAVLEEAIRVAEPEAPDVPVPEKGWPTSGCILGDCWSVAWRVLDAQFWGVPQRRRRICLVADFNGLNAPKIVFGEAEYNGSTEQAGRKSPIGYSGKKPQSEVQPFAKGLSGDLDKSEQKGEAVAGEMMKANLVVAGVDCRNATEYEEQTGSLQFSACHNLNSNNVVRVRYIVRRLTPLECERLQGYPDGWTDIGEWVDSKGKKHKEADSPRYKALGNSIAIPPCKWVLKRLCAFYERDATMASLFDGIGGFPYIWEQLNGKGSCLWASEIEEFPMAVTKLRFGGDDNV